MASQWVVGVARYKINKCLTYGYTTNKGETGMTSKNMYEEEAERMIEAHREAAWRHGFLCGFAWAALAVILAAGISAVWTIAHQPAKVDVLKIEKKK